MSVLRTEKEVAFNDLLVAVKEAMDDYDDFADVLDDPQLADMFRSFTRDRTKIAEQLEAVIRQQDNLPSQPDADKEDLGKLVHRIRAALSEDEVPHALQELIEDEQRILELAQICRQQELTENEAGVVTQLVASVEHALARMRSMATDLAS